MRHYVMSNLVQRHRFKNFFCPQFTNFRDKLQCLCLAGFSSLPQSGEPEIERFRGVGSGLPETLNQAGKGCQGQNLQIIMKNRKLRTKKVFPLEFLMTFTIIWCNFNTIATILLNAIMFTVILSNIIMAVVILCSISFSQWAISFASQFCIIQVPKKTMCKLQVVKSVIIRER